MSALDATVADLEAKRAKSNAERQARQKVGHAFLKEFFEADLEPSQTLKHHGVHAAFDGVRILLQKPTEGVYADGVMIVVGERGEIDINGRSLGIVGPSDALSKKNELIAEIISHFSL